MMHSICRVSLIGLFEKGDYTFSGLVYFEDLMMFKVHWLFSVYYFIDVKDNWTNDWQHDIGTRVLEKSDVVGENVYVNCNICSVIFWNIFIQNKMNLADYTENSPNISKSFSIFGLDCVSNSSHMRNKPMYLWIVIPKRQLHHPGLLYVIVDCLSCDNIFTSQIILDC